MEPKDPTKRKLDTVVFRKLYRDFSDPVFRDAYESYKEIYNNAMAKGKGNLDPRSLAGNPIQLESTNMGSLFKKPGVYNDYFVSTKADGLRYMLLIGNKTIDNSRNVYFVDSGLNFWVIDDLPSIPSFLNVDKSLIDGEILFWGKIEIRKTTKGEITEYRLHKHRNVKPFIGFLAFDILYGPTNPDYVREDLSKIPRDKPAYKTGQHQPPPKFQLGSFGAMVGLKSQTLSDRKTVRWPTTRRRNSLEQMFLNTESPLWSYLHSPSVGEKGLIEASASVQKGGEFLEVIPEQLTVFNFSIFVSPFIPMNQLFDKYKKGSYDFMIKNLQTSIQQQFYYHDPTSHSSKTNVHKLDLPLLPSRKRPDFGKGFFTDGLIFTPARQPYLVGPWTFCDNKQYKWKPVLTADFQVGKLKSSRIETNTKGEREATYFYLGLARSTTAKEARKMEPFVYKFDEQWYTALISSKIELKKGSIVECEVTSEKLSDQELEGDNKPTNYFFFDYTMDRPDKSKPNADNTITSIIRASGIDKESDFIYHNVIIFKIGELYKETDAFIYYTAANIPELQIPGSGFLYNKKLPVLIRSTTELEVGKTYAGTYNGIYDDMIIFDKAVKNRKIGATDEGRNGTSLQFAQKKFYEVYQIPGEYKKKYLPTVLDLIFIIKEQGSYFSEEQKGKILLAFGENRLKKCFVQKHPLCLLSEDQQQSMKTMIMERQKNPKLELELQVKFRDPRYAYANCLINNFIKTDYIPVPVIKAYGKNDRRTTYAKIGDTTLIPEETLIKKKESEVNVTSELFNYDFGLVLSEERKVKGEVKKPTAYEYQNRYTINSLSKWWRLDIIEYGNAKDWESAKKWWENRPRTRVELEYDPGAYFKDIVNWENPQAVQTILGDLTGKVKTHDELRAKVRSYVQELNQADPTIILNDLASVIVKIFRILDMDYGNIDRRKMKIQEQKQQKQQESNKGRQQSVWFNMRNFNNYVKRFLIDDAAGQFENPSLFDISVGRGGDLDKWYRAGIKKVRGIDPNAESIVEANQRFEGRKKTDKKFNKAQLDYQFESERISDPGQIVLPKGTFDIVSCQFTLHYFFETPEMLHLVIRRISEKLVDGGLFIGTTIIGERIEEIDTDEIQIKFLDDKSYTFKLRDISESGNYFNLQDQVEYFVTFDDLITTCAEYNLELVKRDSFRDYYYTWPDRKNPRKKLKNYEKDTAFMYDAFIFRKVGSKIKYSTPDE